MHKRCAQRRVDFKAEASMISIIILPVMLPSEVCWTACFWTTHFPQNQQQIRIEGFVKTQNKRQNRR